MSSLAFDFSGRSVVVTGAARGIGLELARFFGEAGGRVFLADVDREALEEAVAEVGGVALAVDVTDSRAVADAVDAVVEATGRVDVLVNNAGLLRDRVVWKMDDDEWGSVLDTHVGGAFRFTRACTPHFREQHYGRVVSMTSYSGIRGNVGQTNYGAAKAGLIGFTKSAAKELAAFGVTVNAVSPNAETRMVASVPPEKRAELEASIPMRRFGSPAEMCPAVGFLASEEAGYITGVVLPVDGGISM